MIFTVKMLLFFTYLHYFIQFMPWKLKLVIRQNSGKLRVIVGLSVKQSAILKKPVIEKRLLHFFLATKAKMTLIKVTQDTILHFISNV